MINDPYKIVLQPLITEKSTTLKEEHNQFLFKVSRAANKIEIKRAVETLFNVKVLKVNTSTVKGKAKKLGVYRGKRADWKKATVTLDKESKIELLEAFS